MRKGFAITIPVAILLLCSCIVLSTNPVFKTSDLVFENALIGTWGEEGSPGYFTVSKSGELSYLLIDDQEGRLGRFETHLFRLENKMFLDVYPEDPSEDINESWIMHMMPMHSIYRVDGIDSLLTLVPIDYDWVKKTVDANPEMLEHTYIHEHLLIIAPTEKYRQFVIDAIPVSEAWDEPMQFLRLGD